MVLNNLVATNSKQIVDLFATHFSTVYLNAKTSQQS